MIRKRKKSTNCRRFIKVKIRVSPKTFYTFVVILTIFALAIVVYAVAPSFFGHTNAEIDWSSSVSLLKAGEFTAGTINAETLLSLTPNSLQIDSEKVDTTEFCVANVCKTGLADYGRAVSCNWGGSKKFLDKKSGNDFSVDCQNGVVISITYTN